MLHLQSCSYTCRRGCASKPNPCVDGAAPNALSPCLAVIYLTLHLHRSQYFTGQTAKLVGLPSRVTRNCHSISRLETCWHAETRYFPGLHTQSQAELLRLIVDLIQKIGANDSVSRRADYRDRQNRGRRIVTTSDALPIASAQVTQAAAEFQWDGNGFEAGIGVAASGGGFRAMLFHAGAFMRLNELGLPPRTKRISSVSGGSIAAGYLSYVWGELKQKTFQNFKQIYVEPIVAFSRQKIDVVNALTAVLPWTSAAEEIADSYDNHLFKNCTLPHLPNEPRFVFCATNLQTGVLWRFSKPYAGDYVLGRIDQPNVRIAQAVAASSAFPPVLSPLVLKLPPGSFSNWPGGQGPVPDAEIVAFRERVLLTDGGVYDNHGLDQPRMALPRSSPWLTEVHLFCAKHELD
jgi:predicted acylesterase/phospholipase RssA